MDPLADLRLMFAYGDEMNDRLLHAAAGLDAEQLDQPFDLGPGSLRKTLAHVAIGEAVWLERWQGNVDAPWPTLESPSVESLHAMQRSTRLARAAFVASLAGEQLDAVQTYLDSSGTRYRATLREQMLQGVNHSVHHRAQAVHMLKKASGEFIETDFMYWRRRPA